MRREEADGAVAPVVGQIARRVLRIELLDGQQFHRRDAQRLKIGDLLDDARVGPALLRRHVGARMLGEAAHVHLVDHGAGVGQADGGVPLPIVVVAGDDDGFHRVGGVIAGMLGRPAVVAVAHRDGARVGI